MSNAGALKQEWFTAAEFAAEGLPGLPTTKAKILLFSKREEWDRPEWKGTRWRPRVGRGGGVEFHTSVLPPLAAAKLLLKQRRAQGETLSVDKAWRGWRDATDKKKAKAKEKLAVVQSVQALIEGGEPRLAAITAVSIQSGKPGKTIYRWLQQARGFGSSDQLAVLTPGHRGRSAAQEVSAAAWDWLMADYLQPEQRNFTDCYGRVVKKNTKDDMGWFIPSLRTLERKVAKLSPAMVTYCRKGEEAVLAMFPSQRRDRSMFHALEAVNADGHKWDVFVRWPDGTIGRPLMVAFQDLYSNMILSWRVDKTENKEATRLAFGDMVERWGIPYHCYFDNGRGFTSKWITGRTPNRYRFKVKDEEPEGLLTALGVEIHWTRPYSGQSKPIERAFRDFAQGLAKHPRFAGAYTGNKPDAKPENYGSKAVDLDVFMRTVAEGIDEHNRVVGRRTQVCGGKLSFAQAFAASYAQAPIRKANEEQRQLWLMAGEAVRVNRQDGAIEIQGNRYWSDILHPVSGETVTVRFDPEHLHDPLHVYRMDGLYLGQAECVAPVGFADVAAAREHARQRNAWVRGVKMQRTAEGRMTLDQLVEGLPASEVPDPMPAARVVRPIFGNTARKLELDDEPSESERLILKFGAMARAARQAGESGDD